MAGQASGRAHLEPVENLVDSFGSVFLFASSWKTWWHENLYRARHVLSCSSICGLIGPRPCLKTRDDCARCMIREADLHMLRRKELSQLSLRAHGMPS